MIPWELWDEPGALPKGFWIKAVFSSSSHHLLQLHPLPKPPRAKSCTWKTLSPWENKAVPLSRGKAEHRIILSTTPWHSQLPRDPPGRGRDSRGIPEGFQPLHVLQSQEPPAVLPPSLFQAGNQAREVFCGTRFKQDHLCWLGVELFIPEFLGLGLRTWFLLAARKELDVFCPNNPQGLGLILTIFGGTESQVQHDPIAASRGMEGGRVVGGGAFPIQKPHVLTPFHSKKGKKTPSNTKGTNPPQPPRSCFHSCVKLNHSRPVQSPHFVFWALLTFPPPAFPFQGTGGAPSRRIAEAGRLWSPPAPGMSFPVFHRDIKPSASKDNS